MRITIINTKAETAEAIQEMVHESFVANAMVDRMKSVLGVNLAYNNTSNKIHLYIAHHFPIQQGDVIGDMNEAHNQAIVYGDIPLQDTEYQSPKDVIYALLDLVLVYQLKLNHCAKIAFDNEDMHVFSQLMEVVRDFDKTVEQCILLKDKIDLYKDNPSYDNDIEHFWFLGE